MTYFILFLINAATLTLFLVVIKRYFDKRYINKDILSEIKKEINALFVSLNNTTSNNISLIEEKIKNLNNLLSIADKKIYGLDKKINEFTSIKNTDKNMETAAVTEKIVSLNRQAPIPPKTPLNLYDPVNVSKKTNETLIKIIKTENEINEDMKNMSSGDKVRYLSENGYSRDEIRKRLGMDEGEFDFLLNIENITLNFNK